uniref:Uncharacterized protein n=1 Tax=Anguilla anguilla TaxID=7936 RepID=A0A0E9R4M5_ANGAN
MCSWASPADSECSYSCVISPSTHIHTSPHLPSPHLWPESNADSVILRGAERVSSVHWASRHASLSAVKD